MDLPFVNEIISKHSETEMKDLVDSIKSVTEKINVLKLDAKKQMEKKYVQFVPFVVVNEEIIKTSSELVQDVKDLQLRLDTEIKRDVEDLTEELKSLKVSLIESSTIVEHVSKLCKITHHLKEAKEKNKGYETAKHINSAYKYLHEECNDLDFLDLYRNICKTVQYSKVKYCREAIEEWKKSIKWNHIEGDLNNDQYYTSLCISSVKTKMECLLKTLELYEVSDREIASFSDNLLKHFLTIIIKRQCSLTHKRNGISDEELVISSSIDYEKSEYKQALASLRLVFEYIDNLLGVKMEESSFLSTLGEYIADDFLNLLIDECLTDAIPIRRVNVANHTEILDPIINFQTYLISIGFLPESNKLLEEYFGNVESLILNKTIEKYVNRARNLMKRDLHELLEVGNNGLNGKETPLIRQEQPTDKSTVFENETIDVDKLCPNLFKFPKCCVSKSVREFVELIHEILQEALESDSKTYAKFFHLARGIINLYQQGVPMHHDKLLRDIPQYSALLYNNLMYLAHQILTMDYDKRPHTNSNRNLPPISCFADLVVPLRKEAVNVLSQQLSRQEKILLNIIKESGLSALSEYEELPENTEKSIRACLRQLALLKAVWDNILSADEYAEAMGGLCNIMIDEISNRIVATSDIRADIATSLVKVLSFIEGEVPIFFTDASKVILHVKSWSKLKELILVLGASLAQVGERWADGKGPLAVEFTAEQVRQMVKALFQVSDRRSAVLSRIKS